MRKTLFPLILLLFLCGCGTRNVETKNQQPEIIPVKVTPVALKDIKETLDYASSIKAQDEILIYPKVSGKIIEKVKEDGAVLAKGDVIAYIDRDEVGLTFEKAPVESPVAGIVGRVYVDIGTNVTAQTPVALVVNMDTVKINLDIPEKYLPKVSLEQKALITVDAYPDEEFIGTVTKVSPVVDTATRSAPIEISIENQQHHLKSGMFARVRLILETRANIPVIIKEAIMGKEPNLYVFVIENNKAVLRPIQVGIRQGSYYEIKDGVKEGNLVVTMGQQRLHENALVAVEK